MKAAVAPHLSATRPADNSRRYRNLLLGLLAGALLFPFFWTQYALTIGTEVLVAALFAIGLNILIGTTGLVSLGSSMFVGLGGYGVGVTAALMGLPLTVGVPLTLLVVAAVAGVSGFLCIRAKGVGFLLVTLALSQMAYGIATKTKSTGGSDGMTGIPRPDFGWLGLSIDDPRVFYAYALFVTLAVMLLVWRITTSPFGSVLVGIRENERRMAALGYNVDAYKIGAFTVSSVIAAISGIIQAQYTYFVNPESMSWQASGEGVLMVIIGGAGHLLGPLAGSGIYVLVKQALSGITEEYLLVFGIFFVLVVTFLRGGVLGVLSKTWEARK